MPSRAAYTGLAAATSDTGCSTVLMPWVDEPVMVAPEVVGFSMAVTLAGVRAPRFSIPARSTARRRLVHAPPSTGAYRLEPGRARRRGSDVRDESTHRHRGARCRRAPARHAV